MRDKPWTLGRILMDEEGEVQKIEDVRVITDQEQEAYDAAHDRLSQLWKDLELFYIFHGNHLDFENLLTEYAKEMEESSGTSYGTIRHWSLHINRHILNVLTAVRTFLDHTGTRLKRTYGKDSEKVAHFQRLCADAYGNDFSYRFMYKLRNYAQHLNMPLGSFQASSGISGEGSDEEIYHTLDIYFDRDALLEGFDWGSQVSREIGQLPELFNIKPYIDSMIEHINRIGYTMLKEDLPELSEAADVVEKLWEEVQPGIPCFLDIEVQGDPKDVNVGIRWIPLDLMQQVRRIENI